MKQTTLVVGCVLGLVLGIAGWREYHHGGIERAYVEKAEALTEAQEELKILLQEQKERMESCQAEASSREREVQSLQDRCTNLVAQRDHLKAEIGRQAALGRNKAEALDRMDQELQEARQELMEKAALPRELESRLAQATARIGDLENKLDQQFTTQENQPVLQSVEGITRDGTVLALTTGDEATGDLPRPIQLCWRNKVLLTGWINRIETGSMIVHTREWHVPSSTLVKGEKVFILPDRYHEPDP